MNTLARTWAAVLVSVRASTEASGGLDVPDVRLLSGRLFFGIVSKDARRDARSSLAFACYDVFMGIFLPGDIGKISFTRQRAS